MVLGKSSLCSGAGGELFLDSPYRTPLFLGSYSKFGDISIVFCIKLWVLSGTFPNLCSTKKAPARCSDLMDCWWKGEGEYAVAK